MPLTETTAPADPPAGDPQVLERPLLRGRLHRGAFFASIPAAAALLLLASSPAGYVAAAVYGASLIALFGTSAAYHRLDWTPPARARMRRLDHSMIYLLIAGTYTPF